MSLVFTLACSAYPDGKSAHEPLCYELRSEQLHASILDLDIAPGSDLAAVYLGDGRVRVWHLENGQNVQEFAFPEPATDMRQKDENEIEPIRVRFAPDGKTFAISRLSRIYLYDTNTWKLVMSLGVEGEDTMRPIPDPELIPRPKARMRVNDINSGTREWVQRKTMGDGRTRILDFSFTSQGAVIVATYCRASCYDNSSSSRLEFSSGHDPVRLWEIETGRIRWEYIPNLGRSAKHLVASPDGKVFIAMDFLPGHWDIELREIKSGQKVYEKELFLPILHGAPDVVFTRDGSQFLTLWKDPPEEPARHHRVPKFQPWQLALLNTNDGQVTARFDNKAGVRQIALSPDGLRLATTTWRGIAFTLWSTGEWEQLVTVSPNLVGMKIPLLDGIRFADQGREIVVWDRKKGLVFTYQLSGGASKPEGE